MPYVNKVYFKNSQKMSEIPDNKVDLIITSPPYFNIKDYSLDGRQQSKHSKLPFVKFTNKHLSK